VCSVRKRRKMGAELGPDDLTVTGAADGFLMQSPIRAHAWLSD
jgi:hypothetical protein